MTLRRVPLAIASLIVAAATFLLGAALALAAPANPQTLRISVTGPGVVSGAGIGCGNGATCETEVEEGATITLTAAPDNERAMFGIWTGCARESANTCEVEVGASLIEVTAKFELIPQQKLTIATEGTGNVTGISPGPEFKPIECGTGAETCAETYNQGATITLFANHSERTTFTGWTAIEGNPGTCMGTTSPCEVTISEAIKLNAKFEPIPQQKLTVTTEGTGSGSVSGPSPGPEFTAIDCGGTCEASYNQGATITLTAAPAARTTFAGWTGCTRESGDECEVEMTAAESVSASFVPNTQNLEISVSGEGEVSSNPAGVNGCKESGGTCEAEFDEGSKVTLTETPVPGWKFEGWSVACGEDDIYSTCEITVPGEAVEVQAHYSKIPTFPLTVILTGHGTVTSDPAGINCSSPAEECTEELQEGPVTLEAQAATGYTFAGWLGCKHLTASTCRVSLTSETEVTAVFLAEGAQGIQGNQGPQGNTGSQGPQGPQGNQGSQGNSGANGLEGKEGKEGKSGAQGPQGAEGPAGPAGKVTCKVQQKGKKVKVSCSVKYPTSSRRRQLRWSLTRGGNAVRHGVTGTNAGHRLRLDLGNLTNGRYTLHVQGQKGAVVVVD